MGLAIPWRLGLSAPQLSWDWHLGDSLAWRQETFRWSLAQTGRWQPGASRAADAAALAYGWSAEGQWTHAFGTLNATLRVGASRDRVPDPTATQPYMGLQVAAPLGPGWQVSWDGQRSLGGQGGLKQEVVLTRLWHCLQATVTWSSSGGWSASFGLRPDALAENQAEEATR
ncbi:MAG: hypothetical protein IMW99_05550 [Firmicutes bacterium]|nr:hypothetical protein [Bacillota bacterium]